MVSRISKLCAVLAACSGRTVDTASANPEALASVQYFTGSSIWLSPDGASLGADGRVWLRRELLPSFSRVNEDLVSVDSEGIVSHYRVEISVGEGGDFDGQFLQEGATVRIEGRLEGDAWEWNDWSATGTYLDGVMAGYYFRSTASLDEDGLYMDKRIYDATDLYLAKILEDLPLVDREEWEEQTSELGVEFADLVVVNE